MSRFGERMLTQAGLQPLYVPHGVDTQLFHPGVCKRDDARRMLGLPTDGYIVGMVAAFTCGFGSIAGVLVLTYLAWNSDRTPKAPKWMPPPPPNIPPPIMPFPPAPAPLAETAP
jgi:hypothetical protein